MVTRAYHVLPNAPEKILRVMQLLRVRPLDPGYTPMATIRRRQRFYMTPVHYRRGIVWFKASLERAPGLAKSLGHEIHIQKAFGDYEQRFRPRFDSPSFLSSGGRGNFRWLLRKYWQGGFAGDMVTAHGYSPRTLDRISPRRFSAVLSDVAGMTVFMRRRLDVYGHDARWYALDFRHYQQYFFTPLLRDPLNPGWTRADVQRLQSHITHATPYLRRRARYFSHGDLYPNNVMLVGSRPTIVLFDWELANWNTPAFDSVMVYLLAWQRPAWQAKLRRECFRWIGRSAPIDWHLAQLSLATRFAGYAFARLRGHQPDRYAPLPRRQRPHLRRMYRHMIKHLWAADKFLTSHL